MPFQIETKMPEPTIRIFFHGLMVLRAADDKETCTVEIHRNAKSAHVFSAEVRAKIEGKPDIILMRHFGNLEGTHPGLTIEVSPAPSAPVVYKFQPTEIFDPAQENGGDEQDFRWITNLDELHNAALSVDVTQTRPGILIKNGLYYFYAAARLVSPITVTQGGIPQSQIAALASIVGANLFLEDGSEVILTWNEGGVTQTLPLEKPQQAGISYEIYFDNSPLFADQSGGPTHSEFPEYYDIVKSPSGAAIPLTQRFDLLVLNAITAINAGAQFAPPRGSIKFDLLCCPRIPCQSIVLEYDISRVQ
ncbi:MAG TPA: hypothetical protein VGC91_16665 [Pyrinomonadaceae bacterium]|jgi:hypothetical protein